VLPGAEDCLRSLATDPRVIQSTLTGNIEDNARTKLRAFGLDRWIDFSAGGYGLLHDRWLLVSVAQRRAARHGFDPDRDVTVLIGDTPADVEAGRTGGARVLAVATGDYSPAQLWAAGADAVLADLTDLDSVKHHLDMLIEAGPIATESGLAGWARTIATHFLDIAGLRERRWPHTQTVVAKAERIAATLGPQGPLLVAAAWLHDIGYSPALIDSGFHPLDAADFLRSAGVDASLAALVAHHTGAVFEAAERGLADDLSRYPDEVDAVRDALWACDLTTDPDGESVPLAQRLAEITARYGPNHLVTRAITAARPELDAAVERTRLRLDDAGISLLP
jgi:hypothetical protein